MGVKDEWGKMKRRENGVGRENVGEEFIFSKPDNPAALPSFPQPLTGHHGLTIIVIPTYLDSREYYFIVHLRLFSI